MDIKKIVITGGPCAGKTSALKRIREVFTGYGYTVITVPETATELIAAGIAPWTCTSHVEFQRLVLTHQLNREHTYDMAAERLSGAEKVLMVYDRGTMDGMAYITPAEFRQLMDDMGTNIVEMRDRYDAVFSLETAAALGNGEYTLKNNETRSESPWEAMAVDMRTTSAWVGHTHLRLIGASSTFAEKMDHLIIEIRSFLGIPEPLEIEKKFLIEYPDLERFASLACCHKIEIEQIYLKTPEGNARIRKRGEDGHFIYIHTVKRHITNTCRIEIERRITADEYEELKSLADPERRPIIKDRWCLASNGQYFEIDVYPFWSDVAVMEIELTDENDEIDLPDIVEIIRDVTEEDRFKNSSLAKIGAEL